MSNIDRSDLFFFFEILSVCVFNFVEMKNLVNLIGKDDTFQFAEISHSRKVFCVLMSSVLT